MKVALTGHRPERLGLPMDERSKEWKQIRDWLFQIIVSDLGNVPVQKDFKRPVTDIYCGMANGSDIEFGLLAVCFDNIKLHCVLPCKEYNKSNSNYKFLKENANEWVELSDKFYKGCDNARDQYMVDHCDVLIAIWDGNKSGGVWSTIRKAQKAGKEIIYIPKELLKKKENNYEKRLQYLD